MNEFDNVNTSNDAMAFFHQNKDRIYRFYVYKRIFTPRELEMKYIDQSEFASNMARFGLIREAIILPDKDVLLGIAEITDSVDDIREEYRHLEYFKLSEIRLEYYPDDAAEFGNDGIG